MTNREPYQVLLDSAEAAHSAGDHKVAVILAQTAVELFTEKVLGHLYRARDIQYLKPEFEHLLINYNIGNAKVSGLYVALSNDEIKQAPFWANFVAHTELRNSLVHEGADATADQAATSLTAIADLIEHVKAHNMLA